MEESELQLRVRRVTDKFTESMYFLANEPSVALYRLQEHVRRSLPELVQHKTDMQSVEEQCQGAIYTVEYACSAVKSMSNSAAYFTNIEGLLRQAISVKDQMSSFQSRRAKRAPLPFQCWMVYSVNNGRQAHPSPPEPTGSDTPSF
ncbi:BLOC-1-related complex subunit 8 isoform X2 [Hemitrygon akajei]|uniref:BLOC-1-related complex subunit 8 isoform X2 n=1 Tax=Hypanus sabinus TaxID=79690 RepID=UPI0028C4DE1E|nr:BLOC-1-related complex subunit 8 isoform X2 [Hypanus sabinus]